MHIFVKVVGKKDKGGRKIKLLQHILVFSLRGFAVISLKKFLARCALSIAFYPAIRN